MLVHVGDRTAGDPRHRLGVRLGEDVPHDRVAGLRAAPRTGSSTAKPAEGQNGQVHGIGIVLVPAHAECPLHELSGRFRELGEVGESRIGLPLSRLVPA